MTANSRSQQEKNKEAEATTRNPPLAQEVRTYETHLPGWADREGQFVLIKGRAVLGFYPRHEDALDAGYDRLGGGPFLVKQVLSKCRGDSAAAAGPNPTITTIRAGRSRAAAVFISPLPGCGTKGRSGSLTSNAAPPGYPRCRGPRPGSRTGQSGAWAGAPYRRSTRPR